MDVDTKNSTTHMGVASGGSRGGSMGSMEPPLLKGCLRKYYALTYHVPSTLCSHWSLCTSTLVTHVFQLLSMPTCTPEAWKKEVTHLILRASNITRFSSRSSNFCNFTSRIHQNRSQKVRNPKFSWGAHPQTPLAGVLGTP